MFSPEIIFSDHMVLQRNKSIRVFGDCDGSKSIVVTLKRGEKEYTAKASVLGGRFEAVLPAQTSTKPGECCQLLLSDGESEIQYQDVAIGEVWLAGGQSNMELELQNSFEGKAILETPLTADDTRKLLRYYYTPKVAYKDDNYEAVMRNTGWSSYNEDSSRAWSAVAFHFANNLAAELDITIGVIGCNWGGTSASCWMSREALISRSSTESYVTEFESSEHFTKPEAQQVKEYQEYLEYHTEWDKKSAKLYAEVPGITWDEVQERIGKCQYPGPMNCANFTRPYGLYETMVKRLIPYTLGGIIYYQGESDDHKPGSYYDLQELLIKQWRKDFKDDALPFILTQLPMHRYENDPDTKSWPIIRQSQMQIFKDIKNVGIAVIIDQGVFNEIHPPKKQEVGRRLAMQALWFVFNKMDASECFGPLFKEAFLEDKGIRLQFEYAEGGFVTNQEQEKLGFEIAGAEGEFYPAKVELCGTEIVVSSEKVEQPIAVRYLWTNYGEVSLFGRNGLPVAPFSVKSL